MSNARNDGEWMLFEGCRVAYRRAGSGPTLLFVPDHILTGRLWDLQVEYFCASHDVVAADLPPFGRRPPTSDIELSLAFYVRWLERLVDELELAPVAIVGHGLGSLAGLHYAADHAHDVRALVALHTLTAATSRASARQFAADQRAQEAGDAAGSAAHEETRRRRHGRRDRLACRRSSRHVRFARHVLERLAEPHIRDAMLDVSRHAATWVLPHPSRFGEGPPILWLWGDSNRLLPLAAGLAQLESLRPEEVHVFSGSGYATPWEQPDDFNRVVERFLTRQGRRACDHVRPHNPAGAP